MKTLLPYAGCLAAGVLVGLTGCAWLRPPVEGGRGAVGLGEREHWGQAVPYIGQESREREPSGDFKSWANGVLRRSEQTSPGSGRRGR